MSGEGKRYVWDWVDENGGNYVVRKPDGSILCFTSRYKKGYERAQAIAAGMNTAEQGPSAMSGGDWSAQCQYFVEVNVWEDDIDFHPEHFGPFPSRHNAEAWGKAQYDEELDNHWDIHTLYPPTAHTGRSL